MSQADTVEHPAVFSPSGKIRAMAIKITDPGYISEQMFDRVLMEKFHDNADDNAVRNQAIQFLKIFRAGRTHDQIIVDILHA